MSTADLKKRASARRAMLTDQVNLEERANARRGILARVNPNSLEARAQARRAYMQGGPGVNDPKELGYPGEIKYPRMDVPVGGDSREWEQKWFTDAANVSKEKFGPAGVELELKKKLQRASDALRGLEVKAKENPKVAKTLAAKIANDLNGIITDMDKAGYLQEAEEADSVLEEVASFIADKENKDEEEECVGSKCEPEATKEDVKASAKAELVKLANILDGKGYMEEASEIDQILSEL